MAKEYIEREAVFDALFGQYCASCDETEQALNAAIEEIKAIPAAEVVPVVRCGECKFRVYGWCSPHNIWRGENFFCADGERKNGDGE